MVCEWRLPKGCALAQRRRGGGSIVHSLRQRPVGTAGGGTVAGGGGGGGGGGLKTLADPGKGSVDHHECVPPFESQRATALDAHQRLAECLHAHVAHDHLARRAQCCRPAPRHENRGGHREQENVEPPWRQQRRSSVWVWHCGTSTG